MEGEKARALGGLARAVGRGLLRFDYFGHGASSGAFEDGAIGLWREDALAAADHLTAGPLIVVGSSMGAWLACHLALARPDRVKGLLLIAPALDFTERLLRPSLPEEGRAALWRDGRWTPPEGFPITATLLEEGARWLLLPGPIPIKAPVRILQGGADTAVPAAHAFATANALEGSDVVLTLVKDGDHRLSRPSDLERMKAMVMELYAAADQA